MVTRLALSFLYQIFTSDGLAMNACCPIPYSDWTQREFWRALYLFQAHPDMRWYLHVHPLRAEVIGKKRSDQRVMFLLISQVGQQKKQDPSQIYAVLQICDGDADCYGSAWTLMPLKLKWIQYLNLLVWKSVICSSHHSLRNSIQT